MKVILFPGDSKWSPPTSHPSPNSLVISPIPFVLCFPISAWLSVSRYALHFNHFWSKGKKQMGNGLHFPLFYQQFLSLFQSSEKQLFSHSGQSSQLTRKVLSVIYISRWMEKNLPDDSNSQLSVGYKKKKPAGLKPQQMCVYLYSMAWERNTNWGCLPFSQSSFKTTTKILLLGLYEVTNISANKHTELLQDWRGQWLHPTPWCLPPQSTPLTHERQNEFSGILCYYSS